MATVRQGPKVPSREQGSVVRFEKRARECISVARLTRRGVAVAKANSRSICEGSCLKGQLVTGMRPEAG